MLSLVEPPWEHTTGEALSCRCRGIRTGPPPTTVLPQVPPKGAPLPRILVAGPAPSEPLHLPGAPLPPAQFDPFVLKETCGLFCILMLAVSGYAEI